jgi:hypothetical protein
MVLRKADTAQIRDRRACGTIRLTRNGALNPTFISCIYVFPSNDRLIFPILRAFGGRK